MSKHYYIIDCGHGGMSAGGYVTKGKRAPNGSLYEGESVREIGKELEMRRRMLSNSFNDGEVTNWNCNIDIPLRARTKYVNFVHKKLGNVIYISLHHNAVGGVMSDRASGCRFLYQGGKKEKNKTSQKMAEHLSDIFWDYGPFLRNKIVDWSKRPSRLHVLSKPKCPSVIAEIGFMTNPLDVKLIKKNHMLIATNIMRAIIAMENSDE